MTNNWIAESFKCSKSQIVRIIVGKEDLIEDKDGEWEQ